MFTLISFFFLLSSVFAAPGIIDYGGYDAGTAQIYSAAHAPIAVAAAPAGATSYVRFIKIVPKSAPAAVHIAQPIAIAAQPQIFKNAHRNLE